MKKKFWLNFCFLNFSLLFEKNIYDVKLCFSTISIYNKNADFKVINADFKNDVVENKKF